MERRTRLVFLSHAGVDRDEAERVKLLLEDEDIGVRLDSSILEPGLSFMRFMEDALHESDYCLLLWSDAARSSEWVRTEWEAALHKSVVESPGFLIVGRLEKLPVPELLRPRLFLDLFPQLEPGVAELVAVFRSDSAVEASVGKPVAKPRTEMGPVAGTQIYVTSKLFGKTFPMRVVLSTPVAAIVDQIVGMLELPRTTPGAGGVSIRYQYGLALGEESLPADETLEAKGVMEDDVLWLETEVRLISDTEPVRVKGATSVYRDAGAAPSDRTASSIMLHARDEIRARVRRLGLE